MHRKTTKKGPQPPAAVLTFAGEAKRGMCGGKTAAEERVSAVEVLAEHIFTKVAKGSDDCINPFEKQEKLVDGQVDYIIKKHSLGQDGLRKAVEIAAKRLFDCCRTNGAMAVAAAFGLNELYRESALRGLELSIVWQEWDSVAELITNAGLGREEMLAIMKRREETLRGNGQLERMERLVNARQGSASLF